MIDLSQFTPWTLFTDLGFIFILMLIGKIIRVKVKWVQQLFIPPSLIAGLLGLLFGPYGLGWIPLSDAITAAVGIMERGYAPGRVDTDMLRFKEVSSGGAMASGLYVLRNGTSCAMS